MVLSFKNGTQVMGNENEDLVPESASAPPADTGDDGGNDEDEDEDKKDTLSPSGSEEDLLDTVERESWGSKISYILTLVGYAVGFGNIWRFPYLLQENGGIVFLIPYTVSVFLLGIPIFYLELAIGQRLRKGPVATWHEVSPYLGGMGLTTCSVCLLMVFYYNTLVAWVISYIMDVAADPLRYSSCASAVPLIDDDVTCNVTDPDRSPECDICKRAGASQYYWNKRVLNISESISDIGHFNWWILICLVLAWGLVYGILVKGIKAAGKIVYFTALFPYAILLIFLIRGLCLENMGNGYVVLFTPQWEKLADPIVWKTAASQIFFSLGLGFGCLVAFASYLKPNNDCHADAMMIAIINCCTSFFATLTMFPFLGYYGTKVFEECKLERQMTLKSAFGFDSSDQVTFPDAGGVNHFVRDGVQYALAIPTGMDLSTFEDCTLRGSIQASASGTGFVFIVFAQAIATLPGSQFWAALFFIMLLTLGIDSAFGTMEGALAAIVDLQFKLKKWIITTILCGVSFVFAAAVYSWGWGQYVLTFMDDYSANWPLLIVGFAECFGIAWVYGLQRFARDLTLMTGKRPGLYWLICWKYVSPILVFCIMIFTLVDLGTYGVNYNVWSDKAAKLVSVPYPTYAIILGFAITFFIIIWIPVIAILRRFGIKVIKDEASAHFPEEDLMKERKYRESDNFPQDSVTKMVLWGNLQKPAQEDGGSGSELPNAPLTPTESKTNIQQ